MTFVRSRVGPLRLLAPLLAALGLLQAGCGHRHVTAPGTPVLTMSSSSTSFASYIVTVTSVTLTNSNGASYTPLVNPQTVDLVRLKDFSELVEAPAVPSGTYTSATLALDYSRASLWANINGQPVAVAPRDANGNTFTSFLLTITFDPAHQLVINAGQSTRADLHFDLESFNTLNPGTTPPIVLVRPFAVLTPVAVDTTPMRARGLFVTVQNSAFVMNLRPFHDLVSALGAITVNTDAQTYFNINGVTYTGTAGLTALGSLQLNSTVAAYGALGDLSGITPGFTATAVYAGSSLESPLQDHILGVASARSGSILTVHGAELLSALGGISFYISAPVTVSSNTLVSQDGNATGALTLAAVSVGQEIDVSGVASFSSTGVLSFDASAGQVRLRPTQAWGTLTPPPATATAATLDLLTLGGYAPVAFNFTGTAIGGGAVNPAAYLVSTGSSDQSGTATGTLLAATGIVAPFGAAGIGVAPPDFLASSVVTGSSLQQQLVVEWIGGGTATPFTSASSTGLIIDLNSPQLGGVHFIHTGPALLDLKSLPASPLITTMGANANQLNLAIGSTTLGGGVTVYNSTAAFDTALTAAFSGGAHKIYRLVALGQYRSLTNTFIATSIDVALQQ